MKPTLASVWPISCQLGIPFLHSTQENTQSKLHLWKSRPFKTISRKDPSRFPGQVYLWERECNLIQLWNSEHLWKGGSWVNRLTKLCRSTYKDAWDSSECWQSHFAFEKENSRMRFHHVYQQCWNRNGSLSWPNVQILKMALGKCSSE